MLHSNLLILHSNLLIQSACSWSKISDVLGFIDDLDREVLKLHIKD